MQQETQGIKRFPCHSKTKSHSIKWLSVAPIIGTSVIQ